uniref:FIIND domain-containing protein n=1 Tax=Poecilia formosa TaxID=48698 RepID=A0A087XC73_POEFO
MAAVKEILLETLMDLNHLDLGSFKIFLNFESFQNKFPQISWSDLKKSNCKNMVDLLMGSYGQQCLEVTRQVLMDMNRTDLLEKLPEKSCGAEAKRHGNETNIVCFGLTSEALRGFLSEKLPADQRSSAALQKEWNWTFRETDQAGRDQIFKCSSCPFPSEEFQSLLFQKETSQQGHQETPDFNLQSEAGLFECSVSGLRWFCSERVVFRYRFCSWDGHMERMESRGYRPAGPLLDISLITGRMTEVFLPHWICVDDVRKPLEQFAVLHMDDCGDAVEKVSEVSPSHVKLAEPVFSPRAVLMRAGFPVKVYCNMLLYRTNTAFLTLHVYLIPRDPALQQAMDRKESSYGYKVIQKPDPEKSLKMNDYFFLTSDLEAAEVSPKTGIKLRYPRGKPNFFEVYVENANRNFSLTLRPDREDQPVWECSVRKGPMSIKAVAKHKIGFFRYATDKEMLLNLMNDLKQEELKGFKWFLKNRDVSSGFPQIPVTLLDEADASDLVDLMMKTYSHRAVELTKDIFKQINRNDLVE